MREPTRLRPWSAGCGGPLWEGRSAATGEARGAGPGPARPGPVSPSAGGGGGAWQRGAGVPPLCGLEGGGGGGWAVGRVCVVSPPPRQRAGGRVSWPPPEGRREGGPRRRSGLRSWARGPPLPRQPPSPRAGCAGPRLAAGAPAVRRAPLCLRSSLPSTKRGTRTATESWLLKRWVPECFPAARSKLWLLLTRRMTSLYFFFFLIYLTGNGRIHIFVSRVFCLNYLVNPSLVPPPTPQEERLASVLTTFLSF